MKTALSLLVLIATVGFAHAGGFGGPPPFTNGSPLITGVDGSYQATARGTNLVGVFRFTYSGGIQTTNPSLSLTSLLTDPYNDYVFFVEGWTYRGLVQANIDAASIAGVLDNGAANVLNAAINGSVGLGIQSFLAGNFHGNLETNSANANFYGSGTVEVSDYEQQLVVLNPDSLTQDPITETETIITKVFHVNFKFNGVKASLNASSSSS